MGLHPLKRQMLPCENIFSIIALMSSPIYLSAVQKELISRVPILAYSIPPGSQHQKREWDFNRHHGGDHLSAIRPKKGKKLLSK